MPFHVDGEYLTRTLEDLVRINSVNPALVPGAPGEGAIADFVEREMEHLGLEVTRLEGEKGRPSVVGRLPGMGGARTLMLNAHYDTVGVDGMAEPFNPVVRGGSLFGRGAYDMKGSLAACIAAAKGLRDAGIGLAGDLLIAAVADEEHASLGSTEVVQHFPADGAVVTEPTDLDICIAHKGFVWLEVEVLGQAAHGSRPDLGIDANMRMGRVLTELEHLQAQLETRPQHRFVGRPSLHAGLLSGGTAPSVYAARCCVTIERRTVPGETERQVVREVQNILDRLAEEDPQFVATLRTTLSRDPFEVPITSPIVRHLERAVEAVTGHEAIHAGQGPWMDAAILAAAGIDTVVVGPTGGGAHGDEEWVDLESLEQLGAILGETAMEYLG